MPFNSKAQQRWMYANEPEMAKKWSKHTPDHKSLPEKVKKKRKKKAEDALATAWEAIKAPVAAASDAIATKEKLRRKEEEQLQRAVNRHTRERMARRIAAGRVPKMGAYDPPSPRSNRQDDMKEVVYKSLRKQAVAKKLCDLFGDSDPKSHPKGVKVVKRTVKMTPLATVKIKGKREKKAYLELRFCKPQRLKLACMLFEKTVEKLEKQADAARVQGLISQGLNPQAAIRQAYPDWDDNQVANEAAKFPVAKQAAANSYPLKNVGVQQFAPLDATREFSDREKKDISEEKSHMFPKIFKSYKTPITELLSSPGKQSILAALLGGGAGALGGAVLGNEVGAGPAGAAVGGLGVGGLSALLTYFGRKQRNEDVEDLMSRLPEGATRRDMLADPVYQRDLDRQHMAVQGTRSGGDAALLAAALSR
tara:strand:- start:359 stop:1624 length:1266 start_codon:yes stop_codon:yes gene_type:complete